MSRSGSSSLARLRRDRMAVTVSHGEVPPARLEIRLYSLLCCRKCRRVLRRRRRRRCCRLRPAASRGGVQRARLQDVEGHKTQKISLWELYEDDMRAGDPSYHSVSLVFPARAARSGVSPACCCPIARRLRTPTRTAHPTMFPPRYDALWRYFRRNLFEQRDPSQTGKAPSSAPPVSGWSVIPRALQAVVLLAQG